MAPRMRRRLDPSNCVKRKLFWGLNLVETIDRHLCESTFGRIFRLEGSGHPKEISGAGFFTEIRAGLTTFATMAYIIAVNASILSQSGGTCECPRTKDDPNCILDSAYSACVADVKRDLITATAALSGLASCLFGFLTNLPVALAPGMGLNAYFAYQVVGYHGSGPVPYRLALTAVFVEGWIFVALALTGMRQWLCKLIPTTIKTASGVGIGLFLTLIGLSYTAGIGAITGSPVTPTELGGCPIEYLDVKTGVCTGHVMTSPTMWVGICAGGLLTAILMTYRVKTAIIIGIAFVSILSWPRNTSITYFPYTDDGQTRFEFFRQVVAFHPIKKVLAVQEWNLSGANTGHFVLALFTFLYVDIIDCTATLYSMARFCGKTDDRDGDFPRSTIAYCTDALCISFGSLLGCSPVTAFIESGAGIAEGGRTGLTAMTTGLCFLISIFFAPIFASIPPWATGCTLILVGCLMIRQVTQVNWRYIGDAIPSFVAMVFIPFSYSVAYGLIAGIFVYTALNGTIYLIRVVTRGAITPFDYDNKEYWSFRPGGKRPWLIRAITHDGRWWGDHHSHHQSGVELDEGSDRSIAAESHVLSSAPGDEKTNTTTRMQSPARAVLRG